MSAPSTSAKRPKVVSQLTTLALLVALGLALLASVPGLRDVLDRIGDISPVWLALAVLAELASDVSFVVLFRRFFDRLDARDARALAWTEQATGALLPGGEPAAWPSAAGSSISRARPRTGSSAARVGCSS